MSNPICQAVRCATVLMPEKFMCSKHWEMVPRELQREFYYFQKRRREKSSELIRIASMIIDTVAHEEHRRSTIRYVGKYK